MPRTRLPMLLIFCACVVVAGWARAPLTRGDPVLIFHAPWHSASDIITQAKGSEIGPEGLAGGTFAYPEDTTTDPDDFRTRLQHHGALLVLPGAKLMDLCM
ncbi:MAG: hypothetical protein OIF47_15045 [Marinibacterium sp.]|nr:hypothetical protein [Marinibacterium sp.]